MAEGKNIVNQAIEDVKSLKDAMLESAKKDLIESLTPKMKALIERELRGSVRREDVDRLRRSKDGTGETEFEEGRDKGECNMSDKDTDMEMESLASFFPSMSEEEEMPEAAEPADEPMEAAIPTLGEGEDEVEISLEDEPKKKKGKDGDMDEEVEISEAQLRKVYEEALQMEVSLTKGFGDVTKSGELDELDPGAGIADVKKGEHTWENELPPAKQDYTVKEAIRRGLAENRALKKKLGEAYAVIKKLSRGLHETNLFNAKVLHVNSILNRHRLTNEQKKVVMESIDTAESIAEVKKISKSIAEAFRSNVSVVNESRKPKANAQRARTSGAPDQKVLRESVDKGAGEKFARIQQLAGLKKITS